MNVVYIKSTILSLAISSSLKANLMPSAPITSSRISSRSKIHLSCRLFRLQVALFYPFSRGQPVSPYQKANQRIPPLRVRRGCATVDFSPIEMDVHATHVGHQIVLPHYRRAGGKGAYHRDICHRKDCELVLQLLFPRAPYGVELHAVKLEATRRNHHALVLALIAGFGYYVDGTMSHISWDTTETVCAVKCV